MGRPLRSDSPPLGETVGPLTIVIYWYPRDFSKTKNGHAALIIDAKRWMNTNHPNEGPFPGYLNGTEWYVSWSGGQIDWFPRKGSRGGAKGVANGFLRDMDNWGGEPSEGFDFLHRPTKWVALKGLDRDAMFVAWDQARNKEGAHWRLLDKNCATMVHTILKAGGGDQLARAHKKQLVWWPTDLIKYARSMGNRVVMTSDDRDI